MPGYNHMIISSTSLDLDLWHPYAPFLRDLESKTKVLDGVRAKLHKRDENSERAKNSLLIDLLKPARYSPVSVREGLKKS